MFFYEEKRQISTAWLDLANTYYLWGVYGFGKDSLSFDKEPFEKADSLAIRAEGIASSLDTTILNDSQRKELSDKQKEIKELRRKANYFINRKNRQF